MKNFLIIIKNKNQFLKGENMLHDLDVYWIGGSPCSGKSTLAEKLEKDFNMDYYKIDDYLERFMEEGAKKNIKILKMFHEMNLDETWLRDVQTQVIDEFDFYRQTFQFIKKEIIENYNGRPMITEGAALLPELMDKHEIPDSRYICITPTEEFQLKHFKKRTWVDYYLSDCSDPEKAFDNWMKRDIKFAKFVKKEAKKRNKNYIEMDGSELVGKTYNKIKNIFKLKELK